MKKTLLISTALFLSAASFAQTSASNSEAVKDQTNIQHNKSGTQVNSSANASSATTIHTAIVKDARDGSTEQIKEDNQAMAAEKQALAAQAKTKGRQTANTASKGRSEAASANSKAKTDVTSTEDNNLDENSSLKGDESVSGSSDNNQVGKLKSEEKEDVHATLKGDNRSQVAVDKTTATVKDKIDATAKAAENSSLSDDQSVSESSDNDQAGKLKSEEKETVHATLKGDNRSQVAVDKTALAAQHKIDASSSGSIHSAATAAHSVRVKPIPVNAAAHINAAATVRIR